jgi:hypothetical protein
MFEDDMVNLDLEVGMHLMISDRERAKSSIEKISGLYGSGCLISFKEYCAEWENRENYRDWKKPREL